jgi:hypothetical protein
MSDYEQEPMGPYINYLDLISNKGLRTSIFEYPEYVREDKILNSGGSPLAKVVTTEGEELHIVLISSFDGRHWFCWIIEHQRFDIMETGRQWQNGE